MFIDTGCLLTLSETPRSTASVFSPNILHTELNWSPRTRKCSENNDCLFFFFKTFCRAKRTHRIYREITSFYAPFLKKNWRSMDSDGGWYLWRWRGIYGYFSANLTLESKSQFISELLWLYNTLKICYDFRRINYKLNE